MSKKEERQSSIILSLIDFALVIIDVILER